MTDEMLKAAQERRHEIGVGKFLGVTALIAMSITALIIEIVKVIA